MSSSPVIALVILCIAIAAAWVWRRSRGENSSSKGGSSSDTGGSSGSSNGAKTSRCDPPCASSSLCVDGVCHPQPNPLAPQLIKEALSSLSAAKSRFLSVLRKFQKGIKSTEICRRELKHVNTDLLDSAVIRFGRVLDEVDAYDVWTDRQEIRNLNLAFKSVEMNYKNLVEKIMDLPPGTTCTTPPFGAFNQALLMALDSSWEVILPRDRDKKPRGLKTAMEHLRWALSASPAPP